MEERRLDSDSEVPRHRYVVLADVLGFKQLVRNNEHQRLVQIFSGDIRLAAELGATGGVVMPGQPMVPETDLAMLNMRMVSDSIVLWTDGVGPAEFTWLLLAMRNVLKVGIATGVPLRAAMAHGELTHFVVDYPSARLGSDTLIGRALVDAHEAQEHQQWSGGVVLDSAIAAYTASITHGASSIEELVSKNLLTRYEVPIRNRAACAAFAVNWPAAFDAPISAGALEWAFTEYGKKIEDDSVRNKLDNTVAFVSSLGLLAYAGGPSQASPA